MIMYCLENGVKVFTIKISENVVVEGARVKKKMESARKK